jgi:signal transduction histidine kinase
MTDPALPAWPPKDWALRARRLESLCALAAETAGLVELEPVWKGVCGRLPEVLGARAAALRTQLSPGVATWVAEGEDPELTRPLADAVDGEPEGPAWFRAGDLPALRLPLRGGGEPLGALAVAWREEPGDAEDTLAVASLLAALTASALAGVGAYLRLTETAYRRERFFSAMSHDLRTPITAIVGYSELLADGIVGELSRQQQEMVERISQVSGHLAQLVNDILDLAKLDAGRMEFHAQEVRIADLVQEALVAVEPQARSKGLALRVAPDGAGERTILVDAPRIRQILVNLLSNAVKFTDDGEVVIAAGLDDGRAWIEVRDTGPGLPPGSEDDLFEEFLQIATGTRSKREPGSGLGLAISRRLARAMGGDLTARDADGAGAAFTLVLPAAGG